MTEPQTPTTVSPDIITSRAFQLCKYIAEYKLMNLRCFANTTDLTRDLVKAGLHNEIVLLSYLEAGIEKHNGSIKSQVTKIKDMREYGQWHKSKSFAGIDVHKIITFVQQHQEIKDSYELYKLYIKNKS